MHMINNIEVAFSVILIEASNITHTMQIVILKCFDVQKIGLNA